MKRIKPDIAECQEESLEMERKLPFQGKGIIIIYRIIFSVILLGERIRKVIADILIVFSRKRASLRLLHKAYNEEFWGETERAVILYEKALNVYPEMYDIRLSLARSYLRLMKFDQAKVHAGKYLEVDPLNAECNLYMGLCLYYSGDIEKALASLKRVNKLLPDLDKKKSRGLEYMGECYVRSDEFEKAVECFEGSAKIGNSHAIQKMVALGEKYFHEQQHTQALSIFLKIVKIDQKHHEAWNNMGTVFWTMGDRVNAENCFKEALSIHPDYHDALLNMEELKKSLQAEQLIDTF